MMYSKHTYRFLLFMIGFTFLGLQACKDDKEGGSGDSFDRQALLRNTAENIILPAYATLDEATQELTAATGQFTGNPSSNTLTDLKNAFEKAYKAYQRCSPYEFGPAQQVIFRVNLNTYPTDTVVIHDNIASGSYNLDIPGNIDAKGFPALDYLLYHADATTIVNEFSTEDGNNHRKDYLTDLVADIQTKVSTVYNGWKPDGGNYTETFINNLGTDVGSSLGLLVNQLNFDFELIKNGKIGIPLGKKTLGTPLPEKVEAYYSQQSNSYTLENTSAIRDLYLGTSSEGVDGVGLDEYLVHMKAERNGGLLSDAIKTQLNSVLEKLEQIPSGPLSETILNNPAVVDAAYVEIQKQVVLFKSDMPSSLGILITYQDNDGD